MILEETDFSALLLLKEAIQKGVSCWLVANVGARLKN